MLHRPQYLHHDKQLLPGVPGQHLPVPWGAGDPGGHEVGRDVHEVPHLRVVRRQAQAGLAGAVGHAGVRPRPQEGQQHLHSQWTLERMKKAPTQTFTLYESIKYKYIGLLFY